MVAINTASPAFTYGHATVADLKVNKINRTDSGRVTLKDLEIEGQPVVATRRFWRSFFTRFGIAENVFRYFDPHEVFERIHERNNDDSFRYCISQQSLDGVPTSRLLAVTSLKRPVIRFQEISELLEQYGGSEISYRDGLVTSTGNEVNVSYLAANGLLALVRGTG